MKQISSSRGDVIVCDDEDYEILSKKKWHVTGPGPLLYASCNATLPDGRRTTVKMHRLIMGAKVGQQLDHIDGDPLNNRRSNLRFVTNAENQRAKRVKPRTRQCTSVFRGVSWHPKNKRWRARVFYNYRQFCAGCYDTEKEAALAYNCKALHLGFFQEALNKVETA